MSRMRLAVIGRPVLHSRSPALQGAGLAALGLEGWYGRLAVDGAAEALRVGREMGLRGLNVTAPFKEEMRDAVDELEPRARRVGAVNTVLLEAGRAWGGNTDVEGVLGALGGGLCPRPPKGRGPFGNPGFLVLGAGGAARAALVALEGAEVWVVNRTLAKAEALAEEFGVRAAAMPELPRLVAESGVLINAVSEAGRLVEPELLRPDHVVLESQYAVETALARDARAAGATVIDGLEWLLAQGAAAFQHFTNQAPPLQAMREALTSGARGPRPLAGAGRSPALSIALLGMMGSGKSTVASRLAGRLRLPLVDLDLEVERRAARSIPEIFAELGEPRFRELEAQALEAALAGPTCVLACGGGVVLAEQSRRLLRERACGVWLWAEPAELARRVGGKAGRPLLRGVEPEARLARLLDERLDLYGSVAELILPTRGKTPEQIAERIAHETDYAWTRAR